MTNRTVLRSTFALFVTLLLSASAHAGLFRAYVSSTGNDANACTLQAPCRLLPAALAAINDGGEIWMLDSANYNTGPVNIAKSVTILAIPGAVGSVLAIIPGSAGGNAINIATAGVKVTLRNLMIVPMPGAYSVHGIRMSAGASLTVENCLIANLPGSGIYVTTAAIVRVADTTIRDNYYSSVWLQDGASGSITRSTFNGNGGTGVYVYGLAANTTTTVNIADSTFDGNNTGGVYFKSDTVTAVIKAAIRDSRLTGSNFGGVEITSSGAALKLTLSNNLISNNGTAIAVGSFSEVWTTGNTISENGYGLYNSGGLLKTSGNNTLSNNTTDTVGTITPVATM